MLKKLPINIRVIFLALWNVVILIGFANDTWHHNLWGMVFWGALLAWNIALDYTAMRHLVVVTKHEYNLNIVSKDNPLAK